MKNLSILAILIFLTSWSCQQSNDSASANAQTVAFNKTNQQHDYWYQGKAEVSTYTLQQARYGEIREGKASLIFVTEDFSKSKHVKLDNPSSTPEDAVKVLKLNKVKKFNTGLYPYSMMTSVFSPMDQKQSPHALKVSSSIQEWCGHVFMQVNNRAKQYEIQQYSYFESEGDAKITQDKNWLEDELWTILRIDPKALPTGDLQVFPSQFYARLKHRPYRAMPASAKLGKSTIKGQMTYTLSYPQLKRSLKINFDKDYPHQIQSWEETAPADWGNGLLTTSATLLKSKMLAYWSMNGTKDDGMRKEMMLE